MQNEFNIREFTESHKFHIKTHEVQIFLNHKSIKTQVNFLWNSIKQCVCMIYVQNYDATMKIWCKRVEKILKVPALSLPPPPPREADVQIFLWEKWGNYCGAAGAQKISFLHFELKKLYRISCLLDNFLYFIILKSKCNWRRCYHLRTYHHLIFS